MAPESRATSALPPGDVDTGEAPPNLAGTVIGGVAWKLSSRAVSGVTHLVVIVVLARLLTPTDYGIAGMALLVTSFAFIFTDPALGAALVQRPTIDERDRSTVFWLATAIGTVLTILGVLLSGFVADFFDQEQVRDLVIVSSLCLGLTSLSVVHRALLTRRLAYRALEVRDMVATVAGAAVSIGVAAAGFGPWAIVANLLVYVLVGTILVWAFLDWRPRAIFSVSSARKLGGFSAKITSAAVFDWGSLNLDTALVGRYLGAASLGAYSLAYNAMRLPVNYLGRPLFQALSPAYSRIQEDRTRLERVWLQTKRVSIAIIAPALLVLIVVAPDFVPVVLGDQWGDAVVPLQILCIGGLANTLTSLHWSVLQACGEAGVLLRVTVLSAAVTWTAFAAGLHWGIVGVACFYAVAKWLLVAPSTWLTTRAVAFRFWPTLRAGRETVPGALVAVIVGLATRQLLLEFEAAALVRLVLVSAAMLLGYGATIMAVAPGLVRDVRDVVRRRGNARAPTGQNGLTSPHVAGSGALNREYHD